MSVRTIGIASSANISDPTMYSGTLFGLAEGVRANGYEVIGLSSSRSGPVDTVARQIGVVSRLRPRQFSVASVRESAHLARTRLGADRALHRLRNAHVAASLRKSGELAGCIQWGTDFDLPRGTRYVTYDDQTIIQAERAYPYPWITALTPRERSWLIAGQRRVFQDAIGCCATTEWAAASIVADYGIPRERVRVVGIGGNRPALASVSTRDWSRPCYLLVGRDWTRKNGARVLEAFATVKQRHPRAELHLVGGHPMVSQEGVVGHGRRDPANAEDMKVLSELYARATCFVLPSVHEPSALSYVEAMASGIGAIGTMSGGAKTLIGDAGVLVEPQELHQLIAAMQRFAEADTACELGRRAALRSELFSWKSTARRLIDTLEAKPDSRELTSDI
jgi:hypothetical protein